MRNMFAAALLALTLSASASPALFSKYEAVRQGLLKNSLADVQKSAAALAGEARKAKQETLAKQADAVAKSTDLAKARASFAAVSDTLVQLRAKASGAKPSVYHCPMVNKQWLQAKGQVGNPYDPNMAMCGTLKAE